MNFVNAMNRIKCIEDVKALIGRIVFILKIGSTKKSTLSGTMTFRQKQQRYNNFMKIV